MTDNDDILERLKHPELENERHRPDRTLFVRNILNGVFMLMAAVAMIGIVISWSNGMNPQWCYMLGLLAVIIKMVEAMFRMPGLLKRPQQSRLGRSKERPRADGSHASGTADTSSETQAE